MSTAIVKKLFWLTCFCFALELVRLAASSTISYIFLPFNLILAWVPLVFALLIERQRKSYLMPLFFLVWLAFFPNAPYIITDLIHLKPRNGVSFWYDTVMCYSFALTGLLVGMLSALLVHYRLKEIIPAWSAKLSMLAIMLVSGYGVYLGRFLRWNSWNLITSPDDILQDTFHQLTHPFTYPRAYTVTLVIGTLLWLVFWVFESIYPKSQTQSSPSK